MSSKKVAVGIQDSIERLYIALVPEEEAAKWIDIVRRGELTMTLGTEKINAHWVPPQIQKPLEPHIQSLLDEIKNYFSSLKPAQILENYASEDTSRLKYFRYPAVFGWDLETGDIIGFFINFLLSRPDGEIVNNLLILEKPSR